MLSVVVALLLLAALLYAGAPMFLAFVVVVALVAVLFGPRRPGPPWGW